MHPRRVERRRRGDQAVLDEPRQQAGHGVGAQDLGDEHHVVPDGLVGGVGGGGGRVAVGLDQLDLVAVGHPAGRVEGVEVGRLPAVVGSAIAPALPLGSAIDAHADGRAVEARHRCGALARTVGCRGRGAGTVGGPVVVGRIAAPGGDEHQHQQRGGRARPPHLVPCPATFAALAPASDAAGCVLGLAFSGGVLRPASLPATPLTRRQHRQRHWTGH